LSDASSRIRNEVDCKPEKFQSIRLKNAFKELLQICAKLPIQDRQQFTDLLLKHVFLMNGADCYVPWGRWNLFELRTSYLTLLNISIGLADFWWEWALVLSKEPPTCRPEASVLNLIRELTLQNFLLDPFEPVGLAPLETPPSFKT
jgi:hypothetical protein